MPKGEKRKNTSPGGLRQTTMGSYFSLAGNKLSSKKSDKVSTVKKDTKLPSERVNKKRMWGNWAARDTEEYRNRYPGKKEYPNRRDNLLFYTNELSSRPDGDYIDEIHKNWYGDYSRLERHHGYIQWLFPIRESGLNWHAQELQLHEIDAILKDKTARERVLTSYIMMLDFYGMVLKDKETGEIERADNWEDRFRHLNRSFHNYLRITRILKCLGEFEYEHLKAPFIKFVLKEAIIYETLDNLLESCERYWIGVLRDKEAYDDVWEYYDDLYKQAREVDVEEQKTERKKKKKTEPSKGKENKDADSDPDTMPDTLEYGMSLINSGGDSGSEMGDDKPGTSNKGRPIHTMSDTDDDSQEAKYWKQEEDGKEMSSQGSQVELEISGRYSSQGSEAADGTSAENKGKSAVSTGASNGKGKHKSIKADVDASLGSDEIAEDENVQSTSSSRNEHGNTADNTNSNADDSNDSDKQTVLAADNQTNNTDTAMEEVEDTPVSKSLDNVTAGAENKSEDKTESIEDNENCNAENYVKDNEQDKSEGTTDNTPDSAISSGTEAVVADNMDTSAEPGPANTETTDVSKTTASEEQVPDMDTSAESGPANTETTDVSTTEASEDQAPDGVTEEVIGEKQEEPMES